MQFICDLLKQNVDGSAVVLQKISNPSDVNTIIYLYEVFHRIHAMVSIFKMLNYRNKKEVLEYLSLYNTKICLQYKAD